MAAEAHSIAATEHCACVQKLGPLHPCHASLSPALDAACEVAVVKAIPATELSLVNSFRHNSSFLKFHFAAAPCMVDAAPPSSAAESDPGWFEEVAVGALAPGVSPRTASTLKLACGLLLLPELLLLRVSLARGFGVAYVLVLIALSLGFVAAVSWLLSELGTTSVVDQRRAQETHSPSLWCVALFAACRRLFFPSRSIASW